MRLACYSCDQKAGLRGLSDIDVSLWGGGYRAPGQALPGGGYALSYSWDNRGLIQFQVDSETTANRLKARYGGSVKYDYLAPAQAEYVDVGVYQPDGGRNALVGYGYYYVPPGATFKDQQQVGIALGLLKAPTGLDALSDGQFAALLVVIFVGGAVAAGVLATPATASTGSAAVIGESGSVIGTVDVSTGVVVDTAGNYAATIEAGMLGGPAVGTGAELTAAEFAAASASGAVQSTIPGALSTAATTGGLSASQLIGLASTGAKLLTGGAAPVTTGNGIPAAYQVTPGAVAQQNSVIFGLSNTMLIAGAILGIVLIRGKK